METCLLTSHRQMREAASLVSVLNEAGIVAELLVADGVGSSVVSRLEGACVIVALLDTACPDMLAYLGYAQGRGKVIALIRDSKEHIPSLFSGFPAFDLSPTVARDIIKFSRKAMGLPEPTSIPKDPNDLVAWIDANQLRLESLSSADFERVVALLLQRLGINAQTAPRRRGLDLYYDVWDDQSKALVNCKRLSPGSLLGIRHISDSIAEATNADCDFVIILSNAALTEAASIYAKSCVPAIWHLSLDRMTDLLKTLSTKSVGANISDARLSRLSEVAFQASLSSRTKALPGERAFPLMRWSTKESASLFVYFSGGPSSLWPSLKIQIERSLAAGIRLWHNMPNAWHGEHYCKRLDQYSAALANSSVVIVVDNPERHLKPDELKDLSWIAAECVKPSLTKRLTVITADKRRSRLRLPQAFKDADYLGAQDLAAE